MRKLVNKPLNSSKEGWRTCKKVQRIVRSYYNTNKVLLTSFFGE